VTDQPRSRVKDLWQLHLPLVIVLAFCTVATIVEFQRARQGVDRAWAYTFQWPIIGGFAVVVWNRYRKHGSITKSISTYFRNRAARFEAEALAEEERDRATQGVAGEPSPPVVDPDEVAWREHVRRLHEQDPPGGPPSRQGSDR
jgi:hypothetical protein